MSKMLSIIPAAPWMYLAFAFFVPLAVRIGISWIESKRLRLRNGFWLIFKGFGGSPGRLKSVPADYWLAFVIGVIEMFAYPLLIATNQVSFIGVWLAFKTVHRWSYAPSVSRGPYNRYLVANAAVVAGAYFSARWTVVP